MIDLTCRIAREAHDYRLDLTVVMTRDMMLHLSANK